MKSPLSTKQKILSAALQILEGKGIQQLSQLAVAKEVGISQGQLTYHFKKKTDLVLASAQLLLERFLQAYLQNPGSSFLPILLEFIKLKSRARAMFGLILEADTNSELKEKLLEQGKKNREIIAQAIGKKSDHPKVTHIHASLIGYGVLFFLVDDKAQRAKLELDFFDSMKLLQNKKRKKT
jgi:AcrR family transcriptional regulator